MSSLTKSWNVVRIRLSYLAPTFILQHLPPAAVECKDSHNKTILTKQNKTKKKNITGWYDKHRYTDTYAHQNMHEQMASLFFMTKENTERETTICSLGSDIVVNSFKNREQTGQTETKYLCPAVIFALGSFSVLVYSCPLGVQTWSSLCVL